MEMQSKAQKKIIYTDNGVDKAITGHIIEEDDFFIVVKTNHTTYKIGKKSIVCIKDYRGGWE